MSGEDYSHAEAFPRVDYENGNAVLYLLSGSPEEIERYSQQLVDEAGKQPVVDFSAVEHVNSEIAAVIIDLLTDIKAKDQEYGRAEPRKLTVRGLTRETRKVFKRTGLDNPVPGSPLENLLVEKAVDYNAA